MSYYFTILSPLDTPLFQHEFGTSKQGGDGIARFPESARYMNQFVVHASLDVVEEVQWGSGVMYLKVIDRFYNNYISCFLTGGNIKFILLHAPPTTTTSTTSNPSLSSSSASFAAAPSTATGVGASPTSPATEEAIRQFFTDVYELWVKTLMNPFCGVGGEYREVKSNVFRARVQGLGRKYL
ncbi:MAG: TRAPP subunit [Caeruleum heppii]|nr:MAG: TRAPP subunit [Caeruleum heppii]